MKTKDKVLAFCLSIGFCTILFSMIAHGDPSPSPSPAGLAVTTVATTVGGWTAWLNAFTAGGMVATLAGFLEIVLRVIPSQKPLSIAYALDDIFKSIGSFFSSIGTALDKILPNRISGS